MSQQPIDHKPKARTFSQTDHGDPQTPFENDPKKLKTTHSTPNDTPAPPSIDSQFMKQTFSCPTCMEIMTNAHICSCGHSFCHDCITTWLQQRKTCPVCRAPLHECPVPNRIASALIDKFCSSDHAHDEDVSSYRSRALHENQTDQLKKQKLTKLSNEHTDTAPLLDVFQKMSKKDKTRISHALHHFDGGWCRAHYCKLMNLTEHTIRAATSAQLMTAANNLGISPPIRVAKNPRTNTLQYFTDSNFIVSKLMSTVNKQK